MTERNRPSLRFESEADDVRVSRPVDQSGHESEESMTDRGYNLLGRIDSEMMALRGFILSQKPDSTPLAVENYDALALVRHVVGGLLKGNTIHVPMSVDESGRHQPIIVKGKNNG